MEHVNEEIDVALSWIHFHFRLKKFSPISLGDPTDQTIHHLAQLIHETHEFQKNKRM